MHIAVDPWGSEEAVAPWKHCLGETMLRFLLITSVIEVLMISRLYY